MLRTLVETRRLCVFLAMSNYKGKVTTWAATGQSVAVDGLLEQAARLQELNISTGIQSGCEKEKSLGD